MGLDCPSVGKSTKTVSRPSEMVTSGLKVTSFLASFQLCMGNYERSDRFHSSEHKGHQADPVVETKVGAGKVLALENSLENLEAVDLVYKVYQRGGYSLYILEPSTPSPSLPKNISLTSLMFHQPDHCW